MNRKDFTLALLEVTIRGTSFTAIKLGLGGVPRCCWPYSVLLLPRCRPYFSCAALRISLSVDFVPNFSAGCSFDFATNRPPDEAQSIF
ncbi:MAG: hypothetical protein WA705_18540 [Candidatus Ozemobacteraceae bacterium]